MSVREDREEFEQSGLNGAVLSILEQGDEGFVIVADRRIVQDRPAPGSGPYVHVKRGDEFWIYENASAGDNRRREFRLFRW